VAEHIGAGLFVSPEGQQAQGLGFFKQVAEAAKAVGGLAEAGVAPLDGFLEHRGPDLAAVAALGHQRLEGFHGHLDARQASPLLVLPAGALLLWRAPRGGLFVAWLAAGRRALLFAHQVVVENEFVAVGDQEVGGGVLHAHANHLLGVLAQLGDQGRKVRVAADDDEGVDVALGVAEVQRVHHQADVGRVLARLAHMRNLDQLEVGLVHGGLEALVAVPVAVGFLDDDATLEQQALQYRLDVEFFVVCVAHAEGDVLEVAEQRHADGVGGCGHVCSL